MQVKKRKNNRQGFCTKNKRICFDVNAPSLSDSDNSCASSTSSSGDEWEEPPKIYINMFSSKDP